MSELALNLASLASLYHKPPGSIVGGLKKRILIPSPALVDRSSRLNQNNSGSQMYVFLTYFSAITDNFGISNSPERPYPYDSSPGHAPKEFNEFVEDEDGIENDDLGNIDSGVDNFNERYHEYTNFEEQELPISEPNPAISTTSAFVPSIQNLPAQADTNHPYNPFSSSTVNSSEIQRGSSSKRSSLPAAFSQANGSMSQNRQPVNLDPFSMTSNKLSQDSNLAEKTKRMTISNFDNFGKVGSIETKTHMLTGYMAKKETFHSPQTDNCLRIDGTCKTGKNIFYISCLSPRNSYIRANADKFITRRAA